MIGTVACVLKSGEIYDERWVRALSRGLDKHAPDAHLVCLTDTPDEVAPYATPIPLVFNLPGWWSKLELFRPRVFDGPVLYLDLDTLVVGSLREIATYDGDFAMIADFTHDRPEEPGGRSRDNPPHSNRRRLPRRGTRPHALCCPCRARGPWSHDDQSEGGKAASRARTRSWSRETLLAGLPKLLGMKS